MANLRQQQQSADYAAADGQKQRWQVAVVLGAAGCTL